MIIMLVHRMTKEFDRLACPPQHKRGKRYEGSVGFPHTTNINRHSSFNCVLNSEPYVIDTLKHHTQMCAHTQYLHNTQMHNV